MDVEKSANSGREWQRCPVFLVVDRLSRGATLLFLIGHGSAQVVAAQVPATTNSSDTAATSFGGALPNERFVHEFQRQVIQQLQSTMNQASREQDERLQRFEKQQNQRWREQSEVLQRAVDEMQSRQSQHSLEDPSGAPHVNFRQSRDEPLHGGALPMADPTAVETPARSGQINVPQLSHLKTAGANLSPHGFVEGRLLNGVVAIVGGSERESIVALTGAYHAANGFATDLDGCFALVQGRPELPAGRIDFKVSRLTCNFPDGASKTWDVSGWLVDPDGIRGVRAQIVQNAGRKAMVAAAGGALSGLGRRLSQQQYQINAGPLVSSSTFIGNATHDMIGGSAESAANALEQSVADYYNLYSPSLQVGGGTLVSLVIANELKFPSSGHLSTQTYAAAP
ncbi:MAG TPA: TrbI/VirB10 family protein [Burkholderiaceae bacterium]|nr:TrbI/VirB10 family protein [Burkholderiaceae bacterium]